MNYTRKECEHCSIVQSCIDAKAKIDALMDVVKELMEYCDDGSACFDDPAPDSVFLKAKALLATHTQEETKNE